MTCNVTISVLLGRVRCSSRHEGKQKLASNSSEPAENHGDRLMRVEAHVQRKIYGEQASERRASPQFLPSNLICSCLTSRCRKETGRMRKAELSEFYTG